MVVRWIRILMLVGIAVTVAVFVVAFLLFIASLIWNPEAPQSAAKQASPFVALQLPAATSSSRASARDYLTNITPDVQRTAQLETIARSLDSYRYASKSSTYPGSLSALVQAGYLAEQPDPSYVYRPDPSGTFYSVCSIKSDSYECVGSDIGAEDPVTFAASSLDDSSFGSWRDVIWNDGPTSIRLARPPLWRYDSASQTLELDATDMGGSSVVLAKVTFTSAGVGASQTFDQFQKSVVAKSSADISGTKQLTISGFPAYESLIRNPMENSRIFTGTLLLVYPLQSRVYQLSFLTDRTLAPFTGSILLDMLNSLVVTAGQN